MQIPDGLFYTKTHEWAKQQGKEVLVGITDHAQSELSDVVFIELPKVDRVVKAEEACCVVESVKAAFDIYAPVSGKVIRINTALEKDPALVNKDPYGEGWFFALESADPKELSSLLNRTQYEQFLKTSG